MDPTTQDVRDKILQTVSFVKGRILSFEQALAQVPGDIEMRRLSSELVSFFNESYWNVRKEANRLNVMGYVVRLQHNERLYIPQKFKNIISAFSSQFERDAESDTWRGVLFRIPKGTLGVIVKMSGNQFQVGLLDKSRGRIVSRYPLYVGAAGLDFNVSQDEAKAFTKAKGRLFLQKGLDNFQVVQQMAKTNAVDKAQTNS